MEMINKHELIAYRVNEPEDFNFIIATWLNGLFHGNTWFNEIDKEIYFKNYHPLLELLLKNEKTEINIACLKDSPDVILGYAVYTGKTLHYLYVKEVWRHIGIATFLIPSGIQQVSHLTNTGLSILKKKRPNWKFNPFAI